MLLMLNYIHLLFFLECWDGEPDNRPTIYEVVDLLKAMIMKTEVIIANPQLSNVISNKQEINEPLLSTNNSESQGELLRLIQNFNKINIKEIDPIALSYEREKFIIEKDFDRIVDEINDFIIKLYNGGISKYLLKEQITEYLNNYNISLQEIYNWLLNNQDNPNFSFLLGFFNAYGIETSQNNEKAFKLFIYATEKNHMLAQFHVAVCYLLGNGTLKNEKLAFEYAEKLANKNFALGQLLIGSCYEGGAGIEKNPKIAFYWYEKAANNGNVVAMYCLGLMYENGKEITKDSIDKAIYWYEKSGYKDAQEKLEKLQKNQ
jgi:hypothetical protein